MLSSPKKGAKMLNIITDSKDAITILEPVGALSQNDFERASKQIDPLIEKVGQLKGLIIYAESFPYWDSFSAFVKHFVKAHIKHLQQSLNNC